jgi:hypothetical protein
MPRWADEALPLPGIDPTTTKDVAEPDLKVVSSAPTPKPQTPLTIDPLAPLKAMTEEEKIALFS